jgi:peptidoglycan/LPS O-acetylase OafA/YrhL
MKFRTDINGLRALAVAFVVIFHFDESLLQGGFVGVDIFFVISGFLMTGIVLGKLESNNLSIWQFYLSRANRILPALIFLCAAWLFIGYFLFSLIDYKALAKDSIASILFLSNFSYWKTSGYFATAANEKLLLHTWSLSVEWQFYLIYPVVLAVIYRLLGLGITKLALIIGLFLSFLFSIYFSESHSVASYFLLPTRAWEMLLGGIAFVYPLSLNENVKRIAHVVGVILMLVSSFVISSEMAWPGYMALLPCFATYLVLISNQQRSPITNNIVAQCLGKWSYSIYLWHWPIVTLGYYYSLENWFLIGILLSIVAGALSYHFIESANLSNKIPLTRFYKAKPIILSIPVIAVCVFIIANNSVATRFSGEQRELNLQALEAIGDFDYPEPNLRVAGHDVRFIEGTSQDNILFIGASHIEHTYPFVKKYNDFYNVYYLTKGGCFLTASMENPKWSCDNIKNVGKFLEIVRPVKIVTSYYALDGYLPDNESKKYSTLKNRILEYGKVLKEFSSVAQNVYILTEDPRSKKFDPKVIARTGTSLKIPVEDIINSYHLHNKALDEIDLAENIEIIRPIEYLCSRFCEARSVDGDFYFKGSNHFRPWYAQKVMSYLSPIIKPN